MADLEYIRSLHGILTVLIVLFTSISMFVGHLVWSHLGIFFAFYLNGWPLVLMVLIFLFVVWLVTTATLLAQILGKNVIVDLGKMKMLILHGFCAFLLLACAISESYYVHIANPKLMDWGYYPRLIIIMILCYAALFCQIAQIVFIVLRG
ncbi:hypothetical protein M3Y98_00703300 [Aphelenchoides besseyi]|nr:hypothetical protein M3Y98_00703300 [Aphelenchoides besseyi]KAI6210406.1 hypothetical protein M3Y96_00324700 [Aphelenchoides besseyi]